MEVLIATVIFLIFVSTLAGLLYSSLKKHKSVEELYTWTEDLYSKLNDFKQRKELLEEHTDDYINSLGELSTQSLYESNFLLQRCEEMILEIVNTIDSGELYAARSFKRFLENNDKSALGFCPYLAQYMDLIDWQRTLERHIQIIGGNLAVASEDFKKLGVEKRARRPTSASLQAARINLIKEKDL